MESPRPHYPKYETIWLCGRPRFLRETLCQILQKQFSRVHVRDIFDLEPPALTLPENSCWLIWFLNGKYEIAVALEKIVSQPTLLNLLLIQSDGHAFVRWADQVEMHRHDISLEELTAILKTPLDEWNKQNMAKIGGFNDSHWQ